MQERYLTSYEALCAGLTALDSNAIDASIYLLEHAHYHSRSKITTFVLDAPTHIASHILNAWLQADWAAQTAAWWVLASAQRLLPSKAEALRDSTKPLTKIHANLHPQVGTQVAAWIYAWVTLEPKAAAQLPEQVRTLLLQWFTEAHPERALSSLQCLLALHHDIAREDAAKVIARAVDAHIEGADVLGIRCGFIESAERLATQILEGGPWADVAVQAFVQILPEAIEAQLQAVNLRRNGRDREIRVATVLAAHGDVNAQKWLENACKTKDLRRRAMAWAARVRSTSRAGQDATLNELGKLLLREPESVRAWVLSTLDTQHPIHREWLLQARDYGTEEEKSAVQDALRASLAQHPLVPDASETNL